MEKLQGYKINNQFFDTPLDLDGVKVVQAGRHFCAPGAEIAEHQHTDFIELTIVTEGRGKSFANGEGVEIKKNDVFVSFPFDTHAISSSVEAPLKYDHIAFTVENEKIKSLLQEIFASSYEPTFRIITDSRIDYLVYCIIGEFDRNREFSEQLLSNFVNNVVIYLIRAFRKKDMPDKFTMGAPDEIICNRLMNYIDTNIYSLEKLADLEKISGYSYNYLSTLFTKTIGTPLREYYLARKLEVADMLLKEGKLKVVEIAEKLHYSSSSAFNKAYKKKFGFSPTNR